MQKLLDILRASAKWIVGGLVAIALLSTLRACYYGGQVKQVLDTTKPLPQRAVRVLEKQAKVEAAKAAHFEAVADTATRAAAVSRARYQAATKQADSLHALTTALPGPRAGTLAAAVRRVSSFSLADTAR